MKNSLAVFSGNANPALAKRVCDYLGLPLGRADIGRFPDGEIDLKILEDVRGADVYVVQPTCPPVNENLMELLILIDCLRRASAERITAVVPYFGYARQDRKAEGRVPISAKLVANLITAAGASRVLSVDLHAPQIQGFFDIPTDHLYAAPVLIEYFRRLDLKDVTVVSPDVGGIKMARAYAKRLGAGLAICDKRRSGPTETEVMHVIGDVQKRNVVLVDDMISTGTSITEAARACRQHGARDIYICATHAVLAASAVEKLARAPLKEVVVTDTIPLDGKEKQLGNLRILSIANLLGEAIRRIHHSESVSSLFL
ncbi:MAG TPA: ribose-phosphate pyrophosphokinase [Planctomycetota bacterium]|jgi:ribose-phosphate pyrophosphokinase|nr:ribose-phosphate pyrophosphokinase [Planctomycetota bacterium]